MTKTDTDVIVGIEGTGSYGAELARRMSAHGFTVRDVNRPNRAHRRLHGKSDPIDWAATEISDSGWVLAVTFFDDGEVAFGDDLWGQ